MKKYVKRRHRFYFSFVRPIAWIIAKKYHFKTKPVKLRKGENYFILANHQGVMDPVFLALSFKAPVYIVASDSLCNTKLWSKMLWHCFAPIKKRKGVVDIGCIRTARQIAKEGGNVGLFPEGNRAWADFQFHIDKSICKMVRLLKLPLLLYNFTGGYGVNPRWSPHIRKGNSRGEVVKKIGWEEICQMTDEQLYQEIVTTLKVIDSDSSALFKSNRRAEYLERELFVCPNCHSFSTLRSDGNNVTCKHCGLTVTYGENLRLTSPDPNFHFDKLVDWYKYQQQIVANYQVSKGQIVFQDADVLLFDKTHTKRVKLGKVNMKLTDTALTLGKVVIPLDEVINANAIGGRKLIINTTDKSYFVVGNERFNGVKYILFFNILCKKISEVGGDKYYGLSIDNGSD